MYCANCGSAVESGGGYCPNCGTPVGGGAPQQQGPVQQPVPVAPKKKKSIVPIILIIVFGLLALFIGGIVFIFFVIFKTVDNSENKLVCTAPEGNITISYSGNEITGYHASNITYDMDDQKKVARQIGMEEYNKQFTEWFEQNTSGTCTVESATVTPVDDDDDDDVTPTTKTKIVGKDHYGYVEVPTNWGNFQDVNGGNSLQFSYGISYIITLDYIANANNTAKQAAENYLALKKQDSQVTDVNGATVTIGKTKKITAYQVYMYYPAEKTYLITYWFDGDDGYIHYMALEGPDDVSDYLFIPKSFSFTK